MQKLYRDLEMRFERLTSIVTSILGNSVTFIIALVTVAFWLTEKEFYKQDLHHCISDVILGVTFLSFFMIQKSFNRFAGSLHIKLNELVSSHENANNSIINVENKTEEEIKEIAKEYADLVENMNEENANLEEKKHNIS
jgi:low affinity Fe/Cu permease